MSEMMQDRDTAAMED